MRLTPQSLKDQNFKLLEKVDHDNFSLFIRQQRKKFSTINLVYWLFVICFLAMTGYYFFDSTTSIFFKLLFLGLGVIIAFVLTPLHEFIHFLAYKCFGAENVTIKSYNMLGYMLTNADQFVVSKREMKWIATAPFLIITTIGIILLYFLNDMIQISISSMILFHTTLCHADFLILNYFLDSESDIFMYDDIQDESTFIYCLEK